MKGSFFFCLLLLILAYSLCENNSHDYSSYSATSKNENLSSSIKSNTNSDESVVYITNSGITITDSTLTKSGDTSSDVEDCEFYGVNAAVLVNRGSLTMTGGNINTSAKGGNALVATNGGTVTISKTTISSTEASSARGLHSTYGGTITASEVTISTEGGSCATLATDRGEGTVTCTGCTLTTSGSGCPIIYSTGDITVSGTEGTANNAQAVVVEGKNSATIKSSSKLKCTASRNNDKNDECGVLIYQSMSGDADSGTSTFTCESSSIEILSSSSYYSSAPMFFITNTAANINLNSCTFTYGSNTFLKADAGDWNTGGSNGGTATLTLTNQDIEGNIIVGSTSSLTINLVNSSIKGTINGDKTAAKLAIVLDTDSSITLTGNSYYTSLTNSDSSNSNINSGSYTWSSYDETSTNSNLTSSSTTRTRPDRPDDSTTSSTTGTTSNTSDDEDEDIDPIVTSASNLNYFSKLLVFIISALYI